MTFLRSKIFTVLALFLLGVLVWYLVGLWPKKIAVENRLESLEEEITNTENYNDSLSKLLNYFKSPEFLEREAKIKLNLRRPDENVVFIYSDEKSGLSKSEKPFGFSDLEDLTNFEKWLKYLFSDLRGR